jgi:hypothetical protein
MMTTIGTPAIHKTTSLSMDPTPLRFSSPAGPGNSCAKHSPDCQINEEARAIVPRRSRFDRYVTTMASATPTPITESEVTRATSHAISRISSKTLPHILPTPCKVLRVQRSRPIWVPRGELARDIQFANEGRGMPRQFSQVIAWDSTHRDGSVFMRGGI